MKSKLFLIPIIIVILLFGCILKAQAYIGNESDLDYKLRQLMVLRNTDTMQFVNKAELIGFRLEDFNMARKTYNSSIDYAIDQLEQIKDNIQKYRNLSGISENERNIMIDKLYNDANKVILELHNQTNAYIYNVQKPLPTITYNRYKTKFMSFYNSLGF